jgi:hypothetical protein
MGLPDRSGSTGVPSCLASVSQLDKLRELTMNNQMYGPQIHQEIFSGLAERDGRPVDLPTTDGAEADWITRRAREWRKGACD